MFADLSVSESSKDAGRSSGGVAQLPSSPVDNCVDHRGDNRSL